MKKYKIKYQNDMGICEVEIKTSDLSKEKLPLNIISIKENSFFNVDLFFIRQNIADKYINLIFYELDLMLSAGINFNDAINILIKNKKDEKIKDFLFNLKDSLINSSNIQESLKKYRVNYLVGAFLDLSSKKGNISLNIKALNLLLKENYEVKKEFKKSIRYPIVLIVSFLISLISIFYFVIPKFKIIFEQSKEQLPLATKILLSTHYIFENYLIYIFISMILFTISLTFYYKSNPSFRYAIHKFIIKHLFLFKDIYLNLEIYKVFLVIDIMQKSDYEFHNALVSSKVLLKNQYLLDKMLLIENLLKNGNSITYSFSQTKMFDDMILNLLNTAEVSNSLNTTVEEIKKIYKNRFNEKIKLITTLVEPIFLITIMSLIVWIVLAVFMPIWDMGNMIKI